MLKFSRSLQNVSYSDAHAAKNALSALFLKNPLLTSLATHMEETPEGPNFFVKIGVESLKEDHSFIPKTHTLPNGVNVKIIVEETGTIYALEKEKADPFKWSLW